MISTDELIDLIKSQSPQALTILQDQPDYRQVASGQTFFDAGIASDNRQVLDVLVADKKALEFAAPITDELTSAINCMLSEIDIEYPLDKAEDRLRKSFGGDLNFYRTPLLAACRVGNDYAIEALLAAGAKPAAKDRLKLTAPEICFYTRGPDGLETFIEQFKRSGQKPFAVSAGLVRQLLHHPELLDQLKKVGKFGTPVQNLLFCYDCARLNVEAVRKTLAGKFDLNNAITAKLHPVREACISYMFWSDRLPDAGYYAYHYTKHAGPAGSHAIHIDNDLLKPDGSNFNQLMREAEQKRQQLISEAKQLSLSEADAADQLDRRSQIIDLMAEAGLDVELARKKLDEFFFDDLKEMPLQPLAQRLQKYGFTPESVQEAKPFADASWELAGETVLQAKVFYNEAGNWTIELIYSNVYGPVEGVTLSTREGAPDNPTPRDQPQSRSDWSERVVQEEWLDVDGERLPRQDVTEPVYDETPWRAAYRWTQADKPRALEIWVQSPGEEISLVLSGWVVK